MKFLFFIFILVCSASAQAQRIGVDFSCEGVTSKGKKYSVMINDITFAKDISFQMGEKICQFQINDANFKERSGVTLMILNFGKAQSCALSSEANSLEVGFLKVSYSDKFTEAYVLALKGEQSLSCVVKRFNKAKIRSRLEHAF